MNNNIPKEVQLRMDIRGIKSLEEFKQDLVDVIKEMLEDESEDESEDE